MILQDEVLVPLDRNTVFQALNDPEILKASIPGCEELIKHSDTEMEATVVVKFGPVKASFSSNVEIDPSAGPEQFDLTGSGDAGVAGFAKGGARVVLTEQDSSTLLNYEVNIDIGGKLAQIGSRLVEGTSKRLAKKFFTNFEEALLAKYS
ncbi:carbon monoxide dehydrogenase [Chromatiales bacterium (ex Bugula neritina AB1)]|nr:carbon monoxide dehydrogenase [Chromatiales bacterium (ex Bugula neritina AB1)]